MKENQVKVFERKSEYYDIMLMDENGVISSKKNLPGDQLQERLRARKNASNYITSIPRFFREAFLYQTGSTFSFPIIPWDFFLLIAQQRISFQLRKFHLCERNMFWGTN